MSGDIWAARDWTGDLFQFIGEPDNDGTEEEPVYVVGGPGDFLRLPDDMLPDLKPGEKCRVRIERAEST